ncbi:MAG: 1-phosphofructokinase [Eubacterium sp.]|nr:1-phosphofructokinase [Eubacterium sp.]
MIYTVTFNPSMDYIVSVEDFKLGMTNRTATEHMLPGGKGINVSIVLRQLGLDNTALGFVAGFTGEEIIRNLKEYGIQADFIRIPAGISRINVKMKNIDGTEINGMGPEISPDKMDQLMAQLEQLSQGDVLVLAGSIPKSMPDDIYRLILKRMESKKIMAVVDAAGDLLMNVLPYHPFLIKPNNHELGELFDVSITTREQVVPYAKKLQERGAANVLVSMGGQGAVLVSETGEVYMAEAPAGELKNSVGAGDSMVAGFVTGWITRRDYEYAFRMGVSTGSASAFSENLATRAEAEEVMKRCEVIKL